MRSSSLLVTCCVAFSASLSSAASAAPVAGIIDGIVPDAFRPTPQRFNTNTNTNEKSTGAILESLRILPDDDNDGLVDVSGQLKALADGELLDVTGHVKVAGLLDTCVEIFVDGIPTRRCGKKSKSRKHRFHGGLRDDWSKDEHRRCSEHFRAWHRHHDKKDCSDELAALRKRIRDLERELESCRSPEKTFQPNYSVKAVKPQNEQNNWQENNNWQPTNEWHEPQTQQPQQWTWTDENGKVWRNEAHDCKYGVYTYVDKDEINVKACIKAKVDVLGVATVEADVRATATIDLSEGRVDATAKAKVGVDAGPVKVDSETDAKAHVDLKKGQADIKLDTDNTIKLGNTKLLDTGLKAEVALNKNCEGGSILNAAGICVQAKQHPTSDRHENGRTQPAMPLGQILGGARPL